MYEYAAILIEAHDGDTMRLKIDLGFDVNFTIVTRLAHINAPELATTEGKTALKFAQDWFAQHPTLMVRTIKDRKEKYGRYLAVLFPGDQLPTDTASLAGSLNQALLDSGNAVPYEGGAR
jgi:endonuclease YncB( thermonuclease family)